LKLLCENRLKIRDIGLVVVVLVAVVVVVVAVVVTVVVVVGIAVVVVLVVVAVVPFTIGTHTNDMAFIWQYDYINIFVFN